MPMSDQAKGLYWPEGRDHPERFHAGVAIHTVVTSRTKHPCTELEKSNVVSADRIVRCPYRAVVIGQDAVGRV